MQNSTGWIIGTKMKMRKKSVPMVLQGITGLPVQKLFQWSSREGYRNTNETPLCTKRVRMYSVESKLVTYMKNDVTRLKSRIFRSIEKITDFHILSGFYGR